MERKGTEREQGSNWRGGTGIKRGEQADVTFTSSYITLGLMVLPPIFPPLETGPRYFGHKYNFST